MSTLNWRSGRKVANDGLNDSISNQKHTKMEDQKEISPYIVEMIVECIRREQRRVTMEESKKQAVMLVTMAEQTEDWRKLTEKEQNAFIEGAYALYNLKKEFELYLGPLEK